MADHDEAPSIPAQEALEPVDAVEIEVVGRFIEEQHLGSPKCRRQQRCTFIEAGRSDIIE